jgi:hypothetical protein
MLDELYAKAKDNNSFQINNCVVNQWKLTLSHKDQEIFETSLADNDFSTRKLFELYKTAGCTFGLTSLGEHRNGRCGCL